jgi:uncharacterized protein with NRDE domain
MCIAAFAFGVNPDHTLVFAANRDELHTRPTAAADWWPDAPTILGGRDLLAGGSWLAVDRRGRLAAITNLPQEHPRTFTRSRGSLVRDFLSSDQTAAEFAARFAASSADFGPCNLLLWDGAEFLYAATGVGPMRLQAGVHAISNAPLGADWPRVHRAQKSFSASLGESQPEAALLEMLSNGAQGAAESADAALARRRTEIFITDAHYGTRSSTVIVLSADGHARFFERSFGADGQASGERSYAFSAGA